MMKKRLTALAISLFGLTCLSLSGCRSNELMPESPYFGVDDHNKRFVPKELHEDKLD